MTERPAPDYKRESKEEIAYRIRNNIPPVRPVFVRVAV